MLIGSGLPNSTELWPLAVTHAAFCHRCSVQGRKVSWPRWGAKVFFETQGYSEGLVCTTRKRRFLCGSKYRKIQDHSRSQED